MEPEDPTEGSAEDAANATPPPDAERSKLFTLVYDELRAAAHAILRQERPGHTLTPTDLVHEAYLRLASAESGAVNDRMHFRRIAARLMRQILIQHARRRAADKRGGGRLRVTFAGELAVAGQPDFDWLDIEDVLSSLEKLDARKAQVVELRLFAGLTFQEAGEALGVSSKTIEGDWYMARAWLQVELQRKGLGPG